MKKPSPKTKRRSAEMTKRRAAATKRRHEAEAKRALAGECDAYTINSFCVRYPMSQAFFHKMRLMGIGPRLMKVGSRVYISRQAAEEWREAMEAEGKRRATDAAVAHISAVATAATKAVTVEA